MGACTVKSSASDNPEEKILIPSCFYFCRRKKNLFEISSEKIVRYGFKGKMKSYLDSGAGIINQNNIAIIGGTDTSGLLTGRVFVIDPFRKLATEYPLLPRPAKEGHLFEYKKFLYLVGCTIENEDINATNPEQGAPIMRYNTKENFWEIFSHKKNYKDLIKNSLDRKIIDTEKVIQAQDEFNEMSLKNIISPGAFLFDDRIYLVGGKIYNDGKYEITDKIFSFGLEREKFDIREEELKLPVKLSNPVCATGSSHAFIAGGKLENNHQNLQIFVIKFIEKVIVVSEAKFESPIEENYPPTYLENEVVLYSFPMLWIRPKNVDKLHNFTFSKKEGDFHGQVNHIEVVKHPARKPPVEQVVDLRIKLKNGNSPESKKSNVPENLVQEEQKNYSKPNPKEYEVDMIEETKVKSNLESKSNKSPAPSLEKKNENIKIPKISESKKTQPNQDEDGSKRPEKVDSNRIEIEDKNKKNQVLKVISSESDSSSFEDNKKNLKPIDTSKPTPKKLENQAKHKLSDSPEKSDQRPVIKNPDLAGVTPKTNIKQEKILDSSSSNLDNPESGVASKSGPKTNSVNVELPAPNSNLKVGKSNINQKNLKEHEAGGVKSDSSNPKDGIKAGLRRNPSPSSSDSSSEDD
jgi:hypothetical protein